MVFDDTLARGDIGFAESWMAGQWDTDDLSGLLTLLARNRAVLGAAIHGRALRLLRHRLTHLLRPNTRWRARRNIEVHYDRGNDFYALWLDPTMTYSGAVFAQPDEALEAAQLRKYRRILGRLGARPGQIILEIGCGWGGLAELAATEFGCRVLALTLSPSRASRNASARSTTLARPHGLPCFTIATVGVLKSLAIVHAASRSSRLLKLRSLPAIWCAALMLPPACAGSV